MGFGRATKLAGSEEKFGDVGLVIPLVGAFFCFCSSSIGPLVAVN